MYPFIILLIGSVLVYFNSRGLLHIASIICGIIAIIGIMARYYSMTVVAGNHFKEYQAALSEIRFDKDRIQAAIEHGRRYYINAGYSSESAELAIQNDLKANGG